MELDKKTKKILLTIACIVIQTIILTLIFFAEWYLICVENNTSVFVAVIFICAFLMNYWYDLRKEMENIK